MELLVSFTDPNTNEKITRDYKITPGEEVNAFLFVSKAIYLIYNKAVPFTITDKNDKSQVIGGRSINRDWSM